MLTWRVAAFACLAVGCRDSSEPDFEIVRVPQSAYAAPDAAPKVDAAPVASADAGPEPLVLCVSLQDIGEDEKAEEGCPDEYQGRHYDEKATARHRSKGEDSTVCCYRKGRVPRSTRDEE